MNKILLNILFIITLSSISLLGQIQNNDILFGITTIRIVGPNAAGKPFIDRANKDNPSNIFGASYYGPQNGFRLQYSLHLDSLDRIFLPISFDYILFDGRERYPGPSYEIFLINQSSMPQVNVGFGYNFLKLFKSLLKFYVTADAKFSYLVANSFTKQLVDKSVTPFIESDTVWNVKNAAFRVGGGLNLGFKAKFSKNIFINMNLGFSVLNILGRNNARGELLTPFKEQKDLQYFENTENYVPTFNICMMLEYKF